MTEQAGALSTNAQEPLQHPSESTLRLPRLTRMVRPFAKPLVQGFGILLALNFLFFLAILVVNSSVDHRKIGQRLVDFVQSGQITKDNWVIGFDGHFVDRFTDCVALTLNLAGDPDRSAVRMFADSDIVWYDNDKRACPWLTDNYPNANGLIALSYLRYWHGNQLFIKPLITRLSLGEMRLLLGLLAILACLGFFYFAAAQLPPLAVAPLFFSGFFLLTDLGNLNAAFSHSIAIAASFASGILITLAARSLDLRLMFFATIVGSALVCYLDYAMAQLLSLMVALFAVLAATVARELVDTKFLARAAAVTMVGWACGQVGSLVTRIGLAAVIQPDPWSFVRGTLSYIRYRLDGDVPGLTNTAAGAIKANVGVVAGCPFLLPVSVAFILVILALVAKGYRFAKLRHSLWFLVPALLPFLWFAVLRNHSEAHVHIVYRTVVFSLLCAWAVVLYGMIPTAKSSKLTWISWPSTPRA